MGYCYFCEDEWVGYVAGGYFCENCSKLSKLVKCLGSEKLLKNIKFKMDVFDESKKEGDIPVSKNTRSNSSKV
jgi:hypothetical protein